MKLSILIVSHVNRGPLLGRLLDHIHSQKYNPKDVEILVRQNDDVLYRGQDRNKLIDMAKGDYCVFVDDDDVVANDYIDRVLETIKEEPDICGITGEVISLISNEKRQFVLSTKYAELFSLPHKDKEYHRYASHLCPIRTNIIRRVRFPEDIKNEDNDYSIRLKEFVGTRGDSWKETEIPGVLYHYFSRIKLG